MRPVSLPRPLLADGSTIGNEQSPNLSPYWPTEKPMQTLDHEDDKAPYKLIQTIGLSVGAAVAYIIIVLGLMFYCKKRRNAKRLQKGQDGEEPEMECLNGEFLEEESGNIVKGMDHLSGYFTVSENLKVYTAT